MATFGVSFGNGNDGVSQLYPSFYVDGDDAYLIARGACISSFSTIKRRNFAQHEMMVDGEPDFTVYATIMEGPNGQTEFGAAWFIVEVFPVAEDDIDSDKPHYSSPRAAFGRNVMRRLAKSA